MSMESAIKALNAATEAAPAVKEEAPVTPINMANGGANEVIQASQESKENDNGSQKDTSASPVESEVLKAEKETEEAPKKEEPLSSKFAALAKKEKAIVLKDKQIKERETTLSSREAELAKREEAIKQANALFETDPFAALEKYGYSYQKLTDMILSGKTTVEKAPEDPVMSLKKEIETLKKELADKDAKKEEDAKKAQEIAAAKQKEELQKAYEAYREEVVQHVKTNEEDYELINMYEQQDLVIETVQAYYEEHKRVLSVKEASDMVEKYLYQEAEKAMKAKKFTSKKTEVITKKDDAPKAASKTLSNNLTPVTGTPVPATSEQDRMKRALAALNNQR